MKRKQGISLIVLVITIIVMIILAAAVVVSLNNTGIIGKANAAVEATNVKQIEDLASLAWADAYMEGARTQAELQAAVNEALKDVDTSKCIVTVTTAGVSVTAGNGGNIVTEKEDTEGLNEYGFYWNKMYYYKASETLGVFYVFHADGSIDGGFYDLVDEDLGTITTPIICFPAGYVTYANNKAILDGDVVTFTNDGTQMSFTNGDFSPTLIQDTVHGVYRGYTYSCEVDGTGIYTLTLDENNLLKVSLNGTLIKSCEVATLGHDKWLLEEGKILVATCEADGSKLGYLIEEDGDPLIFSIVGTPSGVKTPAVPFAGMSITPVSGSSIANIKAGNPITGDTIEYNGYIYKCNQVYNGTEWITIGTSSTAKCWGVKAKYSDFSVYYPVESRIAGVPVTHLWYTYANSTNTSASVDGIPPTAIEMVGTFKDAASSMYTGYIPSSVTTMKNAYSGCTKFSTKLELPEGLLSLEGTFSGCTSLTSAPTIPSNVTNMNNTFNGCTALTGNVTINATGLTTFTNCFAGTSKAITLLGNCPGATLTSLAATSTAGNVTVSTSN